MVNVINPRIEDINIQDIAHALSHLCRFGGHTKRFYSVAQHSMTCAKIAPDALKLTALLHDASEAYLLDIPTPIKQLLPAYKVMEDRFQALIAKKFGLVYPFPQEIHDIDRLMLEVEWNDLMIRSGDGLVLFKPTMEKDRFITLFNQYKP